MKVKSIKWGNPKLDDYNLILDYFSCTRINSIKTSSVPLAQYWKQPNKVVKNIARNLDISAKEVEVYFEYSTKSTKNNKASMTDVMIIGNDFKIAGEAKYTEYHKSNYQRIEEWFKSGNKENKEEVLEHWKYMIAPFSQINESKILELPYQFLHRSASACYGKNIDYAYVLYQLFGIKRPIVL